MKSELWETPKKKNTIKMRKCSAYPAYIESDILTGHLNSVNDFVKYIDRVSEALKVSQFYDNLRNNLIFNINDLNIKKFIALGIGKLTSYISLIQFSLFVLLINEFKDKCESLESFIFDPLLTELDKSILNKFGINLLDNKNGKYCYAGFHTIFLMLHCPYRLYNNVVWANWNNLDKIVIIGNRFY
jgi:hypothetical protein